MREQAHQPAKIRLQILQLKQQYEEALSGGKAFSDLKHLKNELRHLQKQLIALGHGTNGKAA